MSAGEGEDEPARLRALASYEVLDTPPEPELDAVTCAAARICGAPIALLSLVDRERTFFKARFGTDWIEAPRAGSFCAAAIRGEEILEVPDAALDPRFSAHPLVVATQPLRFYAGAPLLAAIGALCVIDRVPRTLTPAQRDALTALARQVMSILDVRRSSIALRKARQALDLELRGHLRSMSGSLAKLRGSPANLVAAFSNADAAAQLLDDAVDLLGGPDEMHLQRRPMDLGLACGTLAADFQDPAQGAPHPLQRQRRLHRTVGRRPADAFAVGADRAGAGRVARLPGPDPRRRLAVVGRHRAAHALHPAREPGRRSAAGGGAGGDHGPRRLAGGAP